MSTETIALKYAWKCFYALARQLRAGVPLDKYIYKIYESVIKMIDSSPVTTEKTVLYRTVNNLHFDLRVGNIYTDKCFMSKSASIKHAHFGQLYGSYAIHVTYPPGVKLYHIQEEEFLTYPNELMRIDKIEEISDSKPIIHVSFLGYLDAPKVISSEKSVWDDVKQMLNDGWEIEHDIYRFTDFKKYNNIDPVEDEDDNESFCILCECYLMLRKGDEVKKISM